MFFLTQLIGILVIHQYSPEVKQVVNEQGILENKISYEKFIESFNGWYAYAKWSNCYNLKDKLLKYSTSTCL